VAQPFPRFREANAAANYNSPAADGSRPGIFQYPRRIEKMTRFGLRSTVYHETVPGHHFQIALQTEDKSLPRFRQIRAFGGISALTEGWGLYAERLARESGWYGDDIDPELFRARRLVVDTGHHAMKSLSFARKRRRRSAAGSPRANITTSCCAPEWFRSTSWNVRLTDTLLPPARNRPAISDTRIISRKRASVSVCSQSQPGQSFR
jgi:uncharacterized protein (DUF885 family)